MIEQQVTPLPPAYADRGTVELGGAVGASFGADVQTFTASGIFGFYLVRGLALSAVADVIHVRVEGEGDMAESATAFALVGEPSYHVRFRPDMLLFGGVGVGGGYHDDEWGLLVVPRGGLNILISRSTAITPAVRLPIRGGEDSAVDLVLDIGLTTTL